jgi:hypothetical protein
LREAETESEDEFHHKSRLVGSRAKHFANAAHQEHCGGAPGSNPVEACADRTIDDNPTVSTIAFVPPTLQKGFEPFRSAIDIITKGKKLPVYRADLPRTVALVVALLLTVASTSAFAREFRAADTQNEDYPTVQALRYMGRLIAERTNGRLQIRVFHSTQLGEEKETIEQTRVGGRDLRAGNECTGDAVPVSLYRPSAESARRPDRHRDSQ